MKTHLFLTGEIQIGKSTALRKFLMASRVSADGFITAFDSRGENRSLFLSRFDTVAIGDPERQCVARIKGMNAQVFGEVFDTFGAACLQAAGRRELIFMDELGKMEENSPRFKDAVLGRLEGDVPIIGVLKMAPSPFLGAVRGHPKVSVITVTAANRDDMPGAIAAHLSAI